MAEIRQIPPDEYESMKKSYGFTDNQMKSIIGVEPIAVRWADGYGESRKKEEVSAKEKHKQLVEELKNKLRNEQQNSSAQQGTIEASPAPAHEPTPGPAFAPGFEPTPTPTPEPAPAPEPASIQSAPAEEFSAPSFDAPAF